MRLWILFISLLMYGLIAPMMVTIIGSVIGSFSDPLTQIIGYGGPAIFIILFVYAIMFSGEREERY